LIELKNYIENVAFDLVWDNNTNATRNKFLRSVNPYLEGVQNKEGLFAFDVIMDERNNTNADIDRKVLNGLIRIQPTRAIEYVFLTFNITPTGVEFA
jgi:phage tail sheath protein FI